MDNQIDPGFGDALIAFSGEAGSYCCGISDMTAQEYARNYSRMLANRAKGMEFVVPRIPYGLFEANRNLIRSTLNNMFNKHFPDRKHV